MEEHAVYRVLMVEDDRGIAQAVQTQGELWNLQVRQVRDLRHVMEEFAAFDPHLVLLDIGLPCFDGYHWCTEIPPGLPGAGDLYLVCGGQYEHHHGHEPGC